MSHDTTDAHAHADPLAGAAAHAAAGSDADADAGTDTALSGDARPDADAGTDTGSDYAGLERTVRARRTHMLVDAGRAVDPALVEELCALASWAPNHKRTWPWQFALFQGEGRARLGAAYVADMVEHDFGDEGKRAKTLTKYLRTPAVLAVGCAPDPSASLHAENRDAVAAAIQTLLLGATARGLATYWSTAPLLVSPRVNHLCGFVEGTRVIGLVYMGWPTSAPEAPARPAPNVTLVD